MALDWTHPGGPALAQQYVQIMRGRTAQAQQVLVRDQVHAVEGNETGEDVPEAGKVAAYQLRHGLQARVALYSQPSEQDLEKAPGGSPRVTTWKKVLWVLDNLWWRYEEFVINAKRAFKPRRVQGEPRDLVLRVRFSLRSWSYRGLGKVAAAAAKDVRGALMEANNELRHRCYDPPGEPKYYYDRPPTAPEGSDVSTASLAAEDMVEVGDMLQVFRDALANAVVQVRAYIDVLVSDTQRRQAWFDNAMKLISAVTALGGALKPL